MVIYYPPIVWYCGNNCQFLNCKIFTMNTHTHTCIETHTYIYIYCLLCHTIEMSSITKTHKIKTSLNVISCCIVYRYVLKLFMLQLVPYHSHMILSVHTHYGVCFFHKWPLKVCVCFCKNDPMLYTHVLKL